MRQKGFGTIYILIVILITSGIIGGVYYFQNSYKSSNQPTLNKVTRTTPVPTSKDGLPLYTKAIEYFTPEEAAKNQPPDETANWKTYTSNIFKFKVNYPSDWQVKEIMVQYLEDQTGAKIPTGSISFTKDKESVIFTPNFQGSWCDGGSCKVEDFVANNGIKGQKWTSPTGLYYELRIGSNNIAVFSNLIDQNDLSDKIVKSLK